MSCAVFPRRHGALALLLLGGAFSHSALAVSYTHLTLPTKA